MGLFNLFVSVVLVYLFYFLAKVVYRLFLHPLASFPGPRLAAATHLYEIYYDLFAPPSQGGQFARHIAHLHTRYGPIIRITPSELHVSDPDFFSTLYCASTRTRPIDKSEKFRYRFGIPNAAFSTPLSEQHAKRRAALNPFFSKTRIRGLEAKVAGIVEGISKRLAEEYAGTQKVLNWNDVWSSMTMDSVTALAFGKATECSKAENFESPLAKGVQALTWGAHWNAHVPIFNQLMGLLPEDILVWMMPGVKPILKFRSDIRARISSILAGTDIKISEVTIFHDILNSNLPASDKTLDRLTEEALSVVGAGMETTKWILTIATFHLLDNPPIHARLVSELRTALPNPTQTPAYSDLEKLPYLSAVIQEALRISYGQVQRMPRINRLQALPFDEKHTIPTATMVSMDGYTMHSNETIFPASSSFIPERWLQDNTTPSGRPLEHYMVAFGKGSRGCIGRELATMELYLGLAIVFRRFDMQLFETTRSDADFVLDMVAPMPCRESLGVRVRIRGGLE